MREEIALSGTSKSVKPLKDTKTEIVAGIISSHVATNVANLLVVGCGSGLEAAILATCLEAKVIGIDVVDNFAPEASRIADLRLGDAMALQFEDGSFDFVYSYHALEHIPNPLVALKEIKRVLKPEGSYWMGTPNRHRVIGYVGSKEATIGQKVAWNWTDWKAMLTGNFRNELGAHAGFSAKELSSMLRAEFRTVNDMTRTYYFTLYSKYRVLLRLLNVLGLPRFLYPSIYFMGKK